MKKIAMKTPLVEMDGDEMTRILWAEIKKRLILPFVDLKTEYYDLGLPNRDRTNDQVTVDSAEATKRLGVAVKCATITPNAQRVEEYHLHQMWKSPNGTIRAILDGTVFRAPLIVHGINPVVKNWEQPIVIARHAYGDIYKNTEYRVPCSGKAELVYTDENGNETRETIHQFTGAGVIQGVHNLDASIGSFARACFRYALDQKKDLWFATKDTISKIYDRQFRDIFQEIYETEFKEAFNSEGITYFYTLIDDAVARVMRSKGGYIWALKNYDGDVMSDMLAAAFGSLAMMTSVLVSPDGKYEYEAAHGTVTRHYYRYLKGEKTSTNPTATIFAWSGALRKRGELDDLPDLMDFADRLEKATIETIEAGTMTGDLAAMFEGEAQKVDSIEFLDAVAQNIADTYAEAEVEFDVLTLEDEDGNTADYELVYRTEINDNEYVVLLPVDNEDDMAVILRAVYDDVKNEISYADADEKIARRVFDEFQEVCGESFKFEDEEDSPNET